MSSPLGVDDDATSAVVGIGDAADVAALLQMAYQLAHRLRRHPGATGEHGGPGAVAVHEPEDVQHVSGAQVVVTGRHEVAMEPVDDQVEGLDDQLWRMLRPRARIYFGHLINSPSKVP